MIFFNHNRRLTISFILIVITLSVYWQTKTFDYINFDDNEYITENRYVQAGLARESIAWAFTTTHTGPWIPLTWLSYMIGVHLHGVSPGWHHLTNVFFHIANALLLFFMLNQTTQAIWRCCLVAVLFALHPIHVESVAWVSERKDVLSTFFFLLTILGYYRYVKRPVAGNFLLTLLLFVLALMAKPMVVTLPFILILLDYWPLKRFPTNQSRPVRFNMKEKDIKHLVIEKVPHLLLSFIVSLITYASHQNIGSLGSFAVFPFADRIANGLTSYTAYIGKMIWPTRLAVLYPYTQVPLWKMTASFVFLAAVSWLAIRKRHEQSYFIVGWLWYLGTLVPVIGLVNWGNQAMADRFVYIPFIGLYIAVSWGISGLLTKWKQRKTWFVVATIITALALSMLSWQQVGYWKNSVTLFENSLNKTRNNYLMHNNLGVTLELEDRTEAAIAHYRQALNIWPDYADAHNNLGFALSKQGQIGKAIKHYQLALKKRPDFAKAHNNMGNALYKLGRFDEAIEHYSKALEITPNFADAHNNIGSALFRKGMTSKAVEHYLEAVRINPEHFEANNNLMKIRMLKKTKNK